MMAKVSSSAKMIHIKGGGRKILTREETKANMSSSVPRSDVEPVMVRGTDLSDVKTTRRITWGTPTKTTLPGSTTNLGSAIPLWITNEAGIPTSLQVVCNDRQRRVPWRIEGKAGDDGKIKWQFTVTYDYQAADSLPAGVSESDYQARALTADPLVKSFMDFDSWVINEIHNRRTTWPTGLDAESTYEMIYGKRDGNFTNGRYGHKLVNYSGKKDDTGRWKPNPDFGPSISFDLNIQQPKKKDGLPTPAVAPTGPQKFWTEFFDQSGKLLPVTTDNIAELIPQNSRVLFSFTVRGLFIRSSANMATSLQLQLNQVIVFPALGRPRGRLLFDMPAEAVSREETESYATTTSSSGVGGFGAAAGGGGGGFGAQTAATGGFSAGGFGAQPAAAATGGFGGGGFGAQPAAAATGGFGGGGFGAQPSAGGFGAQPSAGGVGEI
jgi:hypothetical protein